MRNLTMSNTKPDENHTIKYNFNWDREIVIFKGTKFNKWTSDNYTITDRYGVFCAWFNSRLIAREGSFLDAEQICSNHLTK